MTKLHISASCRGARQGLGLGFRKAQALQIWSNLLASGETSMIPDRFRFELHKIVRNAETSQMPLSKWKTGKSEEPTVIS